jgi:hypothetical protein
VVTLRHKHRSPLNRMLRDLHAQHLGKPLLTWRNADAGRPTKTAKGTTQAWMPATLNNKLAAHARLLPASDAGDMAYEQAYFDGMHVLLGDLDRKALDPSRKIVRNQLGFARGLMLDPREVVPESGFTHNTVLRHPPAGIWVEPEGGRELIGDMYASVGAPYGCYPIMQQTSNPVLVVLAQPVRVVGTDGELHDVSSFTFVRKGLPLYEAYVFTDFYAQGMSFGSSPVLHMLRKPDNNRLTRANVLVVVSRFASMDALRGLGPLWRDDVEKAAVVDAFLRATYADPTLDAALRRLDAIAAQHRAAFVRQAAAVRAECPAEDITRSTRLLATASP